MTQTHYLWHDVVRNQELHVSLQRALKLLSLVDEFAAGITSINLTILTISEKHCSQFLEHLKFFLCKPCISGCHYKVNSLKVNSLIMILY